MKITLSTMNNAAVNTRSPIHVNVSPYINTPTIAFGYHLYVKLLGLRVLSPLLLLLFITVLLLHYTLLDYYIT